MNGREKAFSVGSAITLPDARGNFFKIGMGNYRPKALNVLIADKIVVKIGSSKYYLDKDKMANVKAQKGR